MIFKAFPINISFFDILFIYFSLISISLQRHVKYKNIYDLYKLFLKNMLYYSEKYVIL